jgi:hypothetical protein
MDMNAIYTKWIAPTQARGLRIKAYTDPKLRHTAQWNHDLTAEGNHIAAATALAKKLRWYGQWVGGPTDHGFVFIVEEVKSPRFLVERKEEKDE